MTEPTAVARPKREGVGLLPAHIQAAIELRKQQNIVAAELAKLNWGSKVDDHTRRAVADWCHRNDVDPATELDVLGNRFYRNAGYYLRKLSELIADGQVEYAVADHVEVDDRLTKLAETAEGDLGVRARHELNRRTMERITHGVPDAAKAAVVFRVKHRALGVESTGVAWCGGGTRKNDPVGDERPGPTAETRAARRCLRLLAGKRPELVGMLGEDDPEGVQLAERVHEQVKEIDSQPRPGIVHQFAMPADPYALPAPKPEEAGA